MTRPHLLLLHGALGSAAQFEQLIPWLVDEYEVHFPDFEGHGWRSANRPFAIEHFAENVLTYLDRSRITGAVDVFGYSMGGYVAMWLARHYPDRVRRIMTLGTKYLWTPEAAAKEMGNMNPDLIEAKVPQFARALAARHSALGWREVLHKTREMIKDLGDHPSLTEADFQRITHPVVVVVGDKDATVSVQEAETVAALLPHGTSLILPDTPHPLERVSTEQLVDLIQGYFVDSAVSA